MEKFLTDYVYIGNDNIPKWVDGYLLFYYGTHETTYIQQLEHEAKTLIWISLDYCRMPTYEPVLTNKEQNASCRIIDVSNDHLFKKLIEYLKERDK